MAASNNPIQIMVRIAFFRDNPKNLPASNLMVALSALATLLAIAILEVSAEFTNNLQLAIAQIVAYGVAVGIVLYIAGKISRWRQTVSALYGTNCVLRCLAYFPLLLATGMAQESERLFWLAAIALPFSIWGLCISAYIFREALETSNGKAFFLALAVNLAVAFIVIQTSSEFVDPVTEAIQ